jgi:hypothetical protein
VVAKVEWHPGELVPRIGLDPLHGSSITNLSRPAELVVAFYNQRGNTSKEGKNATKWTRLACRKLRDSEARLQLHALAYNLANFMRTLALPKEVEHWSAHDAAGEVSEDRCGSGQPWPLGHVPIGRGCHVTKLVPENPGIDQ